MLVSEPQSVKLPFIYARPDYRFGFRHFDSELTGGYHDISGLHFRRHPNIFLACRMLSVRFSPFTHFTAHSEQSQHASKREERGRRA